MQPQQPEPGAVPAQPVPATPGAVPPGQEYSRTARYESAPATRAAGRSRRNLWILLGVVAAVVIGGIIVGVLVFGGAKSAEDTTRDYVKALTSGNADAAYADLSTAMKSRPAPAGAGTESEFADTLGQVLSESGGITGVVVENVQESGTTAVVQYRLTTARGEETWRMGLVKEDGTWKVDSLQLKTRSY